MTEPETILADAIARMCELNDASDAVQKAINDLQHIKGELWLAACEAEDAAGVQTMRDEARDLNAYRSAVI